MVGRIEGIVGDITKVFKDATSSISDGSYRPQFTVRTDLLEDALGKKSDNNDSKRGVVV